MRSYLARVFAMHPLALLAAFCLIPMTVAGTRWLWLAPGASERAARGAAEVLSREVTKGITEWADKAVLPILNPAVEDARGLPGLVDRHATRIENRLFGEVLGPAGRWSALQGGVFDRLDRGLSMIETTRRENVGPLLAAATGAIAKVGVTAETYAALPDRIGAELRPSWRAIEPEITCRQADGTGYGGCWHARTTALMGEAARVGGVFTQRFPEMAAAAVKTGDSFAGITSDAHAWTEKNVRPHPLTKKEKLAAVGRAALMLSVAALRGGAI